MRRLVKSQKSKVKRYGSEARFQISDFRSSAFQSLWVNPGVLVDSFNYCTQAAGRLLTDWYNLVVSAQFVQALATVLSTAKIRQFTGSRLGFYPLYTGSTNKTTINLYI
jgi:hypothetical protein